MLVLFCSVYTTITLCVKHVFDVDYQLIAAIDLLSFLFSFFLADCLPLVVK